MLEYNEILTKKIILVDGEPYEVIDAHIFRMQQRKPQNKANSNGVINDRVVELTFHQSEKAEEAEIEEKEVKYMYQSRGDWWFSRRTILRTDSNLPKKSSAKAEHFLKLAPSSPRAFLTRKYSASNFLSPSNSKSPNPPTPSVVIVRKVARKTSTVETGAVVNAPLFINEGDIIKINTDTGRI